MNVYAKVIAAATVVVVTIAAYQFLTRGAGFGGRTTTPLPSPVLLVRGNFMTSVGEVVALDATRGGSSVTGRMTVSAHGQNEPYAFSVDLQCAGTTEEGLIMIGGVTTDARSPEAPRDGTWAGIVLEPGSPVGASTWRSFQSRAASCLAFLDEQDVLERSTHPGPDGDWTDPIDGTIEFGP